ncbi:RyR domain-containing protein [Solwaraspora sp. WMMD792]|uniref:RyR domain-containing protein n=1 Tax=Solwaraspora sp. WMMD792 TaxID=3016099 RepID=UPI0024168E2C|nr:RyR domain-containing protein [Solwaraspora sp. WMMD792]MDG4772257.1 RyR domain-containing protein [Solwaraspora sp. WMMD792]
MGDTRYIDRQTGRWEASLDQDRNRTTITLLRITFVLLAGVSAILGFVGYAELLVGERGGTTTPVDVLYYTLQLFVLDADQLADRADLPWQLQVARFTAPAATVFALVETARVLLTGELHRLRARRASGHVVVCGDSAMARNLAARLHAAGRKVVVVGLPSGTPVPSRRRWYSVPGDPTAAEVLRAAGVGRAALVYACTDDSTDNILAATTAGMLRDEHNGGMRVYAQLHDPELCLAMQARRLSHSAGVDLRLDFFNVDELAARWLFRQDPLPTVRLSRLLVIGMSSFGRAVLVEAARHWRIHQPDTAGRLRVDLIAADARSVVDDLVHRYPFLGGVCDVVCYEREPDALLPGPAFRVPHDRVLLCLDDEEQALKIALTTPSLWRGGPGSVTVPVTRLAGLAGAFADGDGHSGLLDAISGTVRCYPTVDAASDPDRIGDDLVERLGRSIHDRYLLASRVGAVGSVADPALLPWASLPEDLRRTNRAQAADIGRKLRVLGLALAPRTRTNVAVRLTREQIERLAVLEHQRWSRERRSTGWVHGPRRDRAARTHPDLRPWRELPEQVKEKNRDEMRQIPGVLADVGLEIVRVGTGAPEPVTRWSATREHRR